MSDEKPKTLAEYCEELAARPNHPAPGAVYVTAERYEELKRLQAEAAKPEPLYLRRHPALDAAAQALVGVLAGAAAAREGEDVVVAAYREHLQRAQEEVRACAGALEVGLRERRELSEQLTTARERATAFEQQRDAVSESLEQMNELVETLRGQLASMQSMKRSLATELQEARERGRVAEHALTLAKGTAAALKARVEVLEGALRSECDAFDYHVETGGKTQPGYTQEVWQRNRDAVRGQSPENDPALRGGA